MRVAFYISLKKLSRPKIGLHKKRQMEKNVIPNQDNGVRLDF
jgi:hypothetical protein